MEAALGGRIDKLETTLGDRVGKIEGALAAPKTESRVPPTEVAPKSDPAAQAIAALALEQRLRAGEPFAAEWAALSRLGADRRRAGDAEALFGHRGPDGGRSRSVVRQDSPEPRRRRQS